MSWELALETIEAHGILHQDAENGSLGYWKAIIEKAHADFQASFPGFEPNSFACLVMSTDGRSEDSDFPNLMEPKERERYGI